MAENKKILPIAGLALAAFLLMGGKKASAAQSGEKVEDTIDKIPDDQDKPADDKPNGGGGGGGTKPAINPGPVTENEKKAVWWALNVIGTDVSSDKVPFPYNKKSPEQSMLDWKTNVAFWMTYVSPEAPNKVEGLSYKLDPKTTKDFDYWAAVWIRIRNYIKSVAPTLK